MTQEVTEIGEEIEEIDASGNETKANIPINVPIDLLEILPECVKKRLNVLKNIQVKCAHLEGKFYEEAHSLEMRYAELFKPLYDKRKAIVNALYEPTKDESTWVEPGEDEDEDGDGEQTKQKLKEKCEDEKKEESVFNYLNSDDGTPRGIPEFWLTAMKNAELIEDMIKERDEEVLIHLTDINLILTGKKGGTADEEMGFVLEFHFSPNDYFVNATLTKTYRMKSVPDKDDPFSFDGPEIFGCTGCQIEWNKGKNITQKQIKKKQKHKGGGQIRFITKMVKVDSFFNFFEPPDIPEDEDDYDEDTEDLLAADFEIGDFFRQRLIPKAVLFYTGEAMESDSDSDDEYDDSGESGHDYDGEDYDDDE